jgi:hypothetical protein
MGLKRRIGKERVQSPINEDLFHWLAGLKTFDDLCREDSREKLRVLILRVSQPPRWYENHHDGRDDECRELYMQHRDAVIDAHIWARGWGKRPWTWWHFEGVGPRVRLGGKGTPAFECLNVVPSFRDGIPDLWQKDNFWNWREGGKPPPNWVEWDDDDPPVYESSATYLRRHNLLLHGEARHLKPRDFEPVAIEDEIVVKAF